MTMSIQKLLSVAMILALAGGLSGCAQAPQRQTGTPAGTEATEQEAGYTENQAGNAATNDEFAPPGGVGTDTTTQEGQQAGDTTTGTGRE